MEQCIRCTVYRKTCVFSIHSVNYDISSLIRKSTTRVFQSPILPMVSVGRVEKGTCKRNRVYTRAHAEIVLRVRQFFEKEKSKKQRININKVVERLSEATGVGRTLLAKIRTEADVKNWKFSDGKTLEYDFPTVVPDEYASVIGKVMREILLERKMLPTIDSVFDRLSKLKVSDVEHFNLLDHENVPESDSLVWPWSRSTMFIFMPRIGFVFKDQISHYERSKTREDIVAMRDNYLEWVRNYRNDGYEIYYTDETWIFKNMITKKMWLDVTGSSTQGALQVPSVNSARSILAHVGSETTGLLPGCMLLYRGSQEKKSSDYHSEMCWDIFKDWCFRYVFSVIAKTRRKSVLVMDRATYHSKLDDEDRRPVSSWRKSRLIEAIEKWGGGKEDWSLDGKNEKTKAQLLEYVREIYPPPVYAIQKIAEEFKT